MARPVITPAATDLPRSKAPLEWAVYAEYFTEPYPNRAAIIVCGFARAEMLLEIVAYAATD